MQNELRTALRPAHEDLAVQLPSQQRLNIDETATKEAGGKAWLWTYLPQEGVEPIRPAYGWRPASKRSLRHARAPRGVWSLAEVVVWNPKRLAGFPEQPTQGEAQVAVVIGGSCRLEPKVPTEVGLSRRC